MATKLEQLRSLGGRNVAESTGAARSEGLPPGLDLDQSAGMPARLVGIGKEKGAARIPLGRIVRDEEQPRTEWETDEAADELARLADSLRTRGQLQPIRVRWDEGRGVYVVLLGERRWRAAAMAGLSELSCIIHEGAIDDDEKLALQVIENELRDDLKPMEAARAYRRLMDAKGWSTRQLAAELHLGQSSVVRALSLLELPAPVQDLVESGELPPSVAAEVSKLSDPEMQREIAEAAVSNDLKRHDVAEFVRSVKSRRPAPSPRPDPVTFDVGAAVVTVRWKKAGQSASQVLRKAIRDAQDRERKDDIDAA